MRNVFKICLISLLMAAGPASAQFGGLSVSKGGGVSVADIDAFIGKAKVAEKLVKESEVQLFKAVASKEAIAKYQAEMDAAKKISDPVEQKAKVAEIEAGVEASLKSTDFEKVKKDLQAKEDKKKSEAIKVGLNNLGLGVVKDLDLVASGPALISKATGGIPSPDVVSKVSEMKEVLSSLGNQAESAGKIVSAIKPLMGTVGLDALPTKASSDPMKSPGE